MSNPIITNNRIFLVGFMGSGKTTTGKQMAQSKGMLFFDLDREIEHFKGKTISEIFEEEGEPAFRTTESVILKQIAENNNCIISTGGGTPCFFDNMEFMLANGHVIYLKASAEQFALWLSEEQEYLSRPLLKDIPFSQRYSYIANMLAQREPYYNRANEIIIL